VRKKNKVGRARQPSSTGEKGSGSKTKKANARGIARSIGKLPRRPRQNYTKEESADDKRRKRGAKKRPLFMGCSENYRKKKRRVLARNDRHSTKDGSISVKSGKWAIFWAGKIFLGRWQLGNLLGREGRPQEEKACGGRAFPWKKRRGERMTANDGIQKPKTPEKKEVRGTNIPRTGKKKKEKQRNTRVGVVASSTGTTGVGPTGFAVTRGDGRRGGKTKHEKGQPQTVLIMQDGPRTEILGGSEEKTRI